MHQVRLDFYTSEMRGLRSLTTSMLVTMVEPSLSVLRIQTASAM